jgi:hypothetical protein
VFKSFTTCDQRRLSAGSRTQFYTASSIKSPDIPPDVRDRIGTESWSAAKLI